MSTFLDSIGFDNIHTNEDLQALLNRIQEEGEETGRRAGTRLIRFAPGAGVELWTAITENDEVISVIPAFQGECRQTGLLDTVVDIDDSADGMVGVWVNPTDNPSPAEEEDLGEYPLMFPLVEHFNSAAPLETGRSYQFSITGFALSMRAYESEEQYYTDPRNAVCEQDGHPVVLSHQIVEPIGLYVEDEEEEAGEDEADHSSEAIIQGTVDSVRTLRNPVTETPFYHIVVRTETASFDVLAYPEEVEGELKEGGVVSGVFWLSGRLVG